MTNEGREKNPYQAAQEKPVDPQPKGMRSFTWIEFALWAVVIFLGLPMIGAVVAGVIEALTW